MSQISRRAFLQLAAAAVAGAPFAARGTFPAVVGGVDWGAGDARAVLCLYRADLVRFVVDFIGPIEPWQLEALEASQREHAVWRAGGRVFIGGWRGGKFEAMRAHYFAGPPPPLDAGAWPAFVRAGSVGPGLTVGVYGGGVVGRRELRDQSAEDRRDAADGELQIGKGHRRRVGGDSAERLEELPFVGDVIGHGQVYPGAEQGAGEVGGVARDQAHERGDRRQHRGGVHRGCRDGDLIEPLENLLLRGEERGGHPLIISAEQAHEARRTPPRIPVCAHPGIADHARTWAVTAHDHDKYHDGRTRAVGGDRRGT
jgi:hypothetical protein